MNGQFDKKVKKANGDTCWEWQGRRNKGGYGVHTVGHSIKILAHREGWARAKGPIPAGLCVLHRCDNPPCVRPDHLFLGTRKDNLKDMTRKGRRVQVFGSGSGRAKLTEKQAKEIREQYIPGVIHQKKSGNVAQLCLKYGICKSTIRALVARRTWNHV